ncbi:MAG: YihY/virulence factor BrkB family protein [Chlamydiales bacterium]|nr:YihY/virulence factor BrkB family protein [Chlamydiales bacterium]
MSQKSITHHLFRNLDRIWRTVWFRMTYDQSFLRASSLAFQTILSIVPLIAVMFGIAKGFGLESVLEAVLQDEFRDQQEVINYFIQFGYRLLEETRGGLVAGIGTIFLFFTIMRLFANVENSLNFMWGVKEGRPLGRKISDYLALILICPILIVASSSLTVFITAKLNQITSSGQLPEHIGPLLVYAIPLIPYLMSTALFTLVYMIIPYTNVKLTSSIFAGFCAGCAYQILQATYISIQIQVSNAGAIYGSFAAIPLFMMWLYLSWVIFLVGAQIVVIHQERLWDPRIMEPYRNLTLFERRIAYLSIVKAAVDGYIASKPVSIPRLSHVLGIPERLVNELVEELIYAKIILKTSIENSDDAAIIPAQSPETLKMFDILHQVEGTNELPSPIITQFAELLEAAFEEQHRSRTNKLLKDISITD